MNRYYNGDNDIKNDEMKAREVTKLNEWDSIVKFIKDMRNPIKANVRKFITSRAMQ